MDRMKERAREMGYVTTLFGRRCHLPGIKDINPARRSFMERAAINAPLQGTAADIIKRAMIRIPGALAAQKLKARMLLQVHDELLFEVPEKELEATSLGGEESDGRRAAARAGTIGARSSPKPAPPTTGRKRTRRNTPSQSVICAGCRSSGKSAA